MLTQHTLFVFQILVTFWQLFSDFSVREQLFLCGVRKRTIQGTLRPALTLQSWMCTHIFVSYIHTSSSFSHHPHLLQALTLTEGSANRVRICLLVTQKKSEKPKEKKKRNGQGTMESTEMSKIKNRKRKTELTKSLSLYM